MALFSLYQAIQTAIEAEEHGVKFYSDMAKQFSNDEKLKNIFEALAKDEVEHKKQFTALLESASDKKTELNEDNLIYFKSCDISKFFGVMNESSSYKAEDVLKQAFQFEKESVLYYTGIRDIIGKSEQMDTIIEKEKFHMTQILKYVINESQFRGIEDKW